MNQRPILEICASSYNAAVAAMEAGADRIELCSALTEGGITPSKGLIHAVMKLHHIKKNILIRPRGGDFLYSQAELDIMKDDIKTALELGADGVVIGALRPDGSVNTEAMQELVSAAQNMEVTFHRAFDMCCNPRQALEKIINLGCHRLLTSGLSPKAINGIPVLKELINQASGRIIIMPGCGVNAQNAKRIIVETHATEIHASASSLHKSKMIYRNKCVKMGDKGIDEFSIHESDREKIEEIIKSLS